MDICYPSNTCHPRTQDTNINQQELQGWKVPTHAEGICSIIIIIIEGLSLLQSIPPTTADKQTQAQKRICSIFSHNINYIIAHINRSPKNMIYLSVPNNNNKRPLTPKKVLSFLPSHSEEGMLFGVSVLLLLLMRYCNSEVRYTYHNICYK